MSPLTDLLWLIIYCAVLLFFVIHIVKMIIKREVQSERVASVADAIKSWKPIRFLVPYLIIFFLIVFVDLTRYPETQEFANQYLRIAVVLIFWVTSLLVPNWKKETFLSAYCLIFLWFSGMITNEFMTLIENAYFGGLGN